MGTAGVVEHLFRDSAGRITATLAHRLGRLDLAEEAVADALVTALRTWPTDGVPDNPAGWLFRVSRNRALDLARRESTLRGKLALLARDETEPPAGTDDELALMLYCCDPALPPASRVALTLNTVGGLGAREIAPALLSPHETVAKRLVRAKKTLRESGRPVHVPGTDVLPSRVDSVLAVLYLLFDAGYDAHSGEVAVRAELCREAVRLGRLLLADPRTDTPRVRALVALMLLHGSRLAARVDGAGDVLLLGEQDRSRWDSAAIAEGARLFDAACTGPEISEYHVQAAIALCHLCAPTTGDTDWPRILALYDDLLALRDSPVVRLNRAIAVAMVHGPHAGIAELDALHDDPRLTEHTALPAALGALHHLAGQPGRAAEQYRRALAMPASEPTRRFLRRRLAECTPPP